MTNDYCTVKPCCLICDHAVVEDIDDMDNLIPCHCPENMKNGGSPCMEQGDVCKYFTLKPLLAEDD